MSTCTTRDADWRKDPAATLDFAFDWTDNLADGDTITAATVTSDLNDLTIEPATISDDGRLVTVWISGGTTGTYPRITCHITTAQGRVDERTKRLGIVER